MIDSLTPFLFIPLAGALWLLFLISVIVSLVSLYRKRKLGKVAWLPIGINIAAILIVFFVPFTELWLKVNFALYKADREKVVQEVYSGNLQPNVRKNSPLIKLGSNYPNLSVGGNEFVVQEYNGRKYVFFFTFRGILDNYSGFLYVPDGGDPKLYSDLNEEDSTQIVKYDDHWFYASYH